MIDYGLFRFATPPRTASTWFLQACFTADLGVGFKADVHIPPPDKAKHALNVSLIRNPVDWLASYYHALEGGHVGVPEVDVFSRYAKEADSLNEFIEAYLRNIPGAIGRMHAAYKAGMVMKVEEISYAATIFFESLGGIDKRKLEAVANISILNQFKGQRAIISKGYRNLIRQAEARFCDDYEY